jgi:hypothetical protein
MRLLAVLAGILLLLAGCGRPDEPSPNLLRADAAGTGDAVGLSLPTLTTLDPKQAGLKGPDATVAFTRTGTVTSLSRQLLQRMGLPTAKGEMAAGPGREVLLLVGADAGDVDLVDDGVSSYDMYLLIDGEQRDVPTDLKPDGLMYVNVPIGSTVLLVLADRDRVQSLNLRTGKRLDNAIAGYYPLRRATAKADGLTVRTCLPPFAEGKGWAPDGRLWLVVQLEGSAAKQATVRGPAGERPDTEVPSTFKGPLTVKSGATTLKVEIP